MDLISIPLIIIMGLALILYTISIFSAMQTRKFVLCHIITLHISVLLVIIGLIYMPLVASKLSYAHVTYPLMNMHEVVGIIAVVLFIIHAIIATVLRRKDKKKSIRLGNGFNIFSFILWLVCTILFIMAFYIGIMASIK